LSKENAGFAKIAIRPINVKTVNLRPLHNSTTNKIAYEDLAIKAVDQKIRTNKTADKDLAVLELQNAVAGDNINFVKIPTITKVTAPPLSPTLARGLYDLSGVCVQK
jgi:hypothetical protein